MKRIYKNMETTGNLLSELRKYEKKHWDDSVVAWLDDDHTFGVVGITKDRNGDLQIVVEEVEDELEGIWTVADVIASLEDTGKDARVYLAGGGLYLAIDNRGDIFTEDDDNDVVGCHVTAFGKYEEKTEEMPISEKERNKRGEIMALIAILAGSVLLVLYTAYVLITGTAGHVWESILWLAGATIAAAVCGLTLYYSRRDK